MVIFKFSVGYCDINYCNTDIILQLAPLLDLFEINETGEMEIK